MAPILEQGRREIGVGKAPALVSAVTVVRAWQLVEASSFTALVSIVGRGRNAVRRGRTEIVDVNVGANEQRLLCLNFDGPRCSHRAHERPP